MDKIDLDVGLCTVLIFLAGFILWVALTTGTEAETTLRELEERCEYLGTRVETGFGVDRIARFNCDGTIEEMYIR